VAGNQRALALAKAGYRVGKTDMRTMWQQQLNVYAARLVLLRLQSEQLAQGANLHLVSGGSFEKASAPLAAEIE
jgi:outer membrane protein TolC